MSWFHVTRRDGRTSLFVGSDIGAFNCGAGELARELGDDEVVELALDCVGGCAQTAYEAYELLRHRTRHCRIFSALSAGGVLAMAAPRRSIVASGRMLVHPPRAAVYGPRPVLEGAIARFDALTDWMQEIFERETGQHAEVVAGWLRGETYFNAAEAVAVGLAHEIIPVPAVVAERKAVQLGASAGGCGDDTRLIVEILDAAGTFKVRSRAAVLKELWGWAHRNVTELPKSG